MADLFSPVPGSNGLSDEQLIERAVFSFCPTGHASSTGPFMEFIKKLHGTQPLCDALNAKRNWVRHDSTTKFIFKVAQFLNTKWTKMTLPQKGKFIQYYEGFPLAYSTGAVTAFMSSIGQTTLLTTVAPTSTPAIVGSAGDISVAQPTNQDDYGRFLHLMHDDSFRSIWQTKNRPLPRDVLDNKDERGAALQALTKAFNNPQVSAFL